MFYVGPSLERRIQLAQQIPGYKYKECKAKVGIQQIEKGKVLMEAFEMNEIEVETLLRKMMKEYEKNG